MARMAILAKAQKRREGKSERGWGGGVVTTSSLLREKVKRRFIVKQFQYSITLEFLFYEISFELQIGNLNFLLSVLSVLIRIIHL